MTKTSTYEGGVKKNGKRQKEERLLIELLDVVSKAELTPIQLCSVIPKFLFSVGASLEGCGSPSTSEEVLMRYAQRPTLGNALMAQAMWMRDTWAETEKQRKKGSKNDRTDDV